MGRRGGYLGRVYEDREDIVRQGEVGEQMYVLPEGELEVLVDREGQAREGPPPIE